MTRFADTKWIRQQHRSSVSNIEVLDPKRVRHKIIWPLLELGLLNSAAELLVTSGSNFVLRVLPGFGETLPKLGKMKFGLLNSDINLCSKFLDFFKASYVVLGCI